MTRIQALPGLEAASYPRHALHQGDCLWVEKNCYIDIWIEVLHALRLEPLAVLPFVVGMDFEGDQWTFFKPPHGELMDLYGVDVQELNVWRPLMEHAIEHLGAGKLISTEADAYWLPDTAGTDYRQTHTKTTIVIADLDVEAQRMGYFHNAGYFELGGEDFCKTFHVGEPADPGFLPLFAETIRFDRRVSRSAAELAAMSRLLWQRHLSRRPQHNPVEAFAQRFAQDKAALLENGLAYYHAWAFATVRQLGAGFELAERSAKWLTEAGRDELSPPAVAAIEEASGHFANIASDCKTLILKLARAVHAKRDPDLSEVMARMAQHWQQGVDRMASGVA